jgi:hypothetical protein
VSCRVGELVVECEVEPWQRLGLHVVDGVSQVGGVRLRFVPGTGGLVGWGLVDLPSPVTTIDGLPTHLALAPEGPPPEHALGVLGFDHLVVMTSSLERTCGAIEAATGAPLKRVREAGSVRQGFHRLGEVIVEVVESAQVTAPIASFWGFVWNLADLHEACATLGPEVVSLPKPAVQPGRFIATVRSSAGLRLPLAVMSA